MDWKPYALELAEQVSHPRSRWRDAIATTPRHLLVPNWWTATGQGWAHTAGSADLTRWYEIAYAGRRSVVTRVGSQHADDAGPETVLTCGRPTSSATMPYLMVQMFSHLRVFPGARILDCGTGSGYGAALLSKVAGAQNVVSVDVDQQLTGKAAGRLADMGIFPVINTLDATAELPGAQGEFDLLLATFSVRTIPASWLMALRVGGRFVTTIANTSMVVTGYKTGDGGADGRVERDWAGFMQARHGDDYPPQIIDEVLDSIRAAEGDQVSIGRFPVVNVQAAWELMTMLEVTMPGIQHAFEGAGDGLRTALMAHPDGSWARAEQRGDEPPTVHQGGERRLWDTLDELRLRWLRDGSLPVYGSTVRIDPDGAIHLSRGGWSATLT